MPGRSTSRDYQAARALRALAIRARADHDIDRFGIVTDDVGGPTVHVHAGWGTFGFAMPTLTGLAPFDRPQAGPIAVPFDRTAGPWPLAELAGAAPARLVLVPTAEPARWFWALVGEAATEELLARCQALAGAYERVRADEPDQDARRRLAVLDTLESDIADGSGPNGTPADPSDPPSSAIVASAVESLGRIVPHDRVALARPNAAADVVPGSPWAFDAPSWWCPPGGELRYLVVDDAHVGSPAWPGITAGDRWRSLLAMPIVADGRVAAILVAAARAPARFGALELFAARQVTDRAMHALEHATSIGMRTRLQTRAANIERLDALLAPLALAGSVHDVFEELSGVARSVLQHDAVMLPVRIGEGTRARLYASSGMGPDLPETIPVPAHLVEHPDWDHDIVDDIQSDPAQAHTIGAVLGYRSLLRVSAQLDGAFAGALVFLSRTPHLYGRGDLLLARRMTDRLALAISRERREQEMRRADEAVERASRLQRRVNELANELDTRTGYRRVVGESQRWQGALSLATQVAATQATVLLLGESGTGKEVVARFVHRASTRAEGPFVALNCAALPEQLLEAELFGYERGAFTGAMQSRPGQLEQAAGGTLFLDEVGEMSPAAQAKFLRVLQEREFQRLGGTRVLRTDVRVIAATNRDLERAMARGDFREDLFYRLDVFRIELPPLRDRRDDILPLSDAFVADIAATLGRPPGGISKDAQQCLLDYGWPGNVRELRNVLERAAILCDGGLITSAHLALPPARVRTAAGPRDVPAELAAAASSAPGSLEAVERAMIERALQEARFNKSQAARALGLTRAQLYVRLKRHKME